MCIIYIHYSSHTNRYLSSARDRVSYILEEQAWIVLRINSLNRGLWSPALPEFDLTHYGNIVMYTTDQINLTSFACSGNGVTTKRMAFDANGMST
jgi:hypothetical protein